MAEDMAADLGYEVVGTANNLQQGLDAIAECHPDVALLDLRLHSETSLPIAALCRQLGVGVAFITGYRAENLPDECGDAPVLAKPFSLVDLGRTLRRAEGSRSAPAIDAETRQRQKHSKTVGTGSVWIDRSFS
jgi:DNA-binding NarL/FixJ family response regulator